MSVNINIYKWCQTTDLFSTSAFLIFQFEFDLQSTAYLCTLKHFIMVMLTFHHSNIEYPLSLAGVYCRWFTQASSNKVSIPFEEIRIYCFLTEYIALTSLNNCQPLDSFKSDIKPTCMHPKADLYWQLMQLHNGRMAEYEYSYSPRLLTFLVTYIQMQKPIIQ